ncbi:hypothetical protein JNUCC42_04315 [Brevibacterium sp. JNUCC-42]|nr:hypothetical protein JNUCC42_04315 [Brevibacterium sp. JNUCC-42]
MIFVQHNCRMTEFMLPKKHKNRVIKYKLYIIQQKDDFIGKGSDRLTKRPSKLASMTRDDFKEMNEMTKKGEA